jgi:hypothetical protein
LKAHRPWYCKKRLVVPVVFCVLIISFCFIFSYLTKIFPPQNINLSVLSQAPDTTQSGVVRLGRNKLMKNPQGLWEMYITGEAFERGKAFGKMCQPLIYHQEQAFVDQIKNFVPNAFYLKFLKYLLAWFNKDLDKYIPVEYLREMYGVSLAHSPDFEFVGEAYSRVLNYHAAHDIGHALRQYMLVGCSSFAVKDELSEDGKLLIGRNFDFFVGDAFAENKIVAFCNPDSGHQFMWVTWPGFIGAASGMNMAGLTVTINAASSTPPLGTKTPIAILTREILQYASNIEEAVAIANRRETFVSESILIGSAIDKKAVIIEKSPEKTAVFSPATYPLICTNHYQSPEFENDKMNIENIQNSDSPYRFRRLAELIQQENALSPLKVAEILRNKEGIAGETLGFGNQLAINQLVAHHSVIFKPEELKVWVSASPYQLGEYVCYDLHKVFAAFDKDTIPDLIQDKEINIKPDNFKFTSQLRGYENYRKLKHYIQYFSTVEKSIDLSDSWLKTFEYSNPNLYITHVLMGDYYQSRKRFDESQKAYKKALSLPIATKDEEKLIEEKLKKVSR